MTTPAPAPSETPTRSESDLYKSIAAPLHTVLIAAIVGVLAYLGKVRSDQARVLINVDRIRIYERTMLFEWLVLGWMIAGVWLRGSPLRTVLGDRWHSATEVARDIGIAVVFLFVSVTFDSIVASHGHGSGPDPTVRFLLPHGSLEIALWIGVSITAGFCEEALYRGYFQRQFTALTKSVPAGILLSAAAFGTAHSYQGLRLAASIGVMGAASGLLAHWRKSVRPGMIAHALQDVLAVVVRH